MRELKGGRPFPEGKRSSALGAVAHSAGWMRRVACACESFRTHTISMRENFDSSNTNRVGVVRAALIDAGVRAGKIQSGALGDPQLRRDGRVEVLVSN
jgi:hypothetical protein